MFSRKLTLLVSIIALLIGAVVVTGQSNAPNWCDEGGKWYNPDWYAPFTNRCDAQPGAENIEFMWVNGYYGALYDAGGITLEELFALAPTIAGNIITVDHPELLLTSPAPIVSPHICYVGNTLSYWINGERFDSDDCTDPWDKYPVVTALDSTAANNLCQVLDTHYTQWKPETTPTWPSNLWLCVPLP